ncbi:hypothetical protein [Roseomonas mucosa]|uniref:hypothetical protein n=1 Tax=Roseomonas mucosa TaxID=207340 RepID=UPI001D33B195|nr:hypothetical protein [Roseomonas mucosa]MBS5905044.1 hypothetical protein [Acetobacteraceae bacterium]MCG7353308.1 hypothetical protein [Roseomonas mucosa]
MGQQYDAWLAALDDRSRALVRLSGRYGQRQWEGMGFFDVPGRVLRDLAAEGLARMSKASGHSATEFRGTAAAVTAAAPLRRSMPAYPA